MSTEKYTMPDEVWVALSPDTGKGTAHLHGNNKIGLDRTKYIRADAPRQSALDPNMPAEELRLHMGELTANEVRVARAAIAWANRSRAPTKIALIGENYWTPDHNEAVHFCRKIDAERFIDSNGWTEVFPSQHIWQDGKPTREVTRKAIEKMEEEND